jgi:hypothetical protein
MVKKTPGRVGDHVPVLQSVYLLSVWSPFSADLLNCQGQSMPLSSVLERFVLFMSLWQLGIAEFG